MNSKPKKILIALVVIAVVAAVTGYLMWNKPHQDVAESAGKKVDAIALYSSFVKDSAAAKMEFVQQVLEVSGTIVSVAKNQQNQQLVLLKTGSDGASVNCTFEGDVKALSEGTNVTIKGICNGMGEGDADLGILGDVYLVRCYLVQ